jgi:putative ABC transport system permease protein
MAPIIAGTTVVSRQRLSREVLTIGTTPGFFSVRRIDVGRGRILPEASHQEALAVCILGAHLKKELFGSERAVGEWVRVGERRVRVVGVLRDEGESLGMDMNDMVIIPVRTAEQLFDSPKLFRVLLELQEGADTETVTERLRAVVRERHEGEDDVTIVSQDSLLAAFDNILTTVTLAISAIAAISLLVAGILIMNISLISVSQRRREIGLLKAVGASRRQVRQLFLGEAFLLVALGSVLGIAVAVAGVVLMRELWPAFPLMPPWWAAPAAVITAVLSGLVFSWLPASRAARLDPVLALRGNIP